MCNAASAPVREAKLPKSAGVYVFYEANTPQRVGTTKNLCQRVKQHHGPSLRSAAFAKRLARCATGIRGGTRPGEGWKTQACENPQLGAEFEKARERIRNMQVRWVEVPDADCRYLLEFYAAKELGTPHNDYRET